MFKRFGVGFFIVILLIGVGLLILGDMFLRRSVPALTGSATVFGIHNAVHIDRDSFGVPSIYARTDEEAYFGLGYAEAQDRLFQMEMERRIGEGRLSEIIGKPGLTLDKWAHTIGFTRIAHLLWQKSSPQTKAFLTSYIGGINAYIADHHSRPGYEFDALHFTPEKWKPEECLTIGRLMSWEMNFGYWTDAAYGDIALAVDSSHLRALMPEYPADGPTVVEGSTPEVLAARWTGIGKRLPGPNITPSQIKPGGDTSNARFKPNVIGKPVVSGQTAPKNSVKPPAKPAAPSHKSPLNQGRPKINAPHVPVRSGEMLGEPKGVGTDDVGFFLELAKVNKELQAALGPLMSGGGSNSFVLGPSRTTTGSAILENDTHLRLSTPARWYLAHLHSEEGLNVAGFGVPGLPLIIAGRNEQVSWGITSGMADESDFFIETLDSTGKSTLTSSGFKSIVEFVDTIRVKDSVSTNPMHSLPFLIRQSIHGPLILEHPFVVAHSYARNNRAGAVPQDTTFFRHRKPVALAWNGEYAFGDELGAFFSLHRAENITEARSQLKLFATPVLNLCLADRSGEIAYEFIGRLPRKNGTETRGFLPRDGSISVDQWLGFISAGEIAKLSNPTRGYIVSANNPPIRQRTVPVSAAWEPGARADRIAQLIEESKKLDAAAMGKISRDITSPFDRDLVMPYLLALYPDPNPYSTAPDSTWLFRLDSLHHVWRWDSILHHTSLPDSAARQMIHADSLMLRAPYIGHGMASQVQTPTATALEYLRNWDGGMRDNETAPTIYAVFLNTLLKNIFADELGSDRFAEFCYDGDLPLNSLTRLLREPENIWWDDVTTRGAVPETRDSIIKLSLEESLRILKTTFGSDMSRWQWARLHTLTYRHQFEAAGPSIARLVNIEIGAVPGGFTSVSQATYDIWNPYAMRVGPSMRMISDMRSNTLLAVLPTGNSEAIFGSHYRDMVQLFKNGGYDAIELQGRSAAASTFELLPAR